MFFIYFIFKAFSINTPSQKSLKDAYIFLTFLADEFFIISTIQTEKSKKFKKIKDLDEINDFNEDMLVKFGNKFSISILQLFITELQNILSNSCKNFFIVITASSEEQVIIDYTNLQNTENAHFIEDYIEMNANIENIPNPSSF